MKPKEQDSFKQRAEEISKQFGISIATAYNWLREIALPLNYLPKKTQFFLLESPYNNSTKQDSKKIRQFEKYNPDSVSIFPVSSVQDSKKILHPGAYDEEFAFSPDNLETLERTAEKSHQEQKHGEKAPNPSSPQIPKPPKARPGKQCMHGLTQCSICHSKKTSDIEA